MYASRLIILFLSLGCAGFLSGQSKVVKQSIHIDCTCEDVVGKSVLSKLRDAIARSPRYQLSSTQPKNVRAANGSYTFTLKIVSLDEDQANTGHSAAISSVLLIDGTYLSQFVQTCGIDKVAQCADTALSSIDADIVNLLEAADKRAQSE